MSDDSIADALNNAPESAEATSPAMTAAPPPTDNQSEGQKFDIEQPPPPPNVDFTQFPQFKEAQAERDKLQAGQRADTQTMLKSMQGDINSMPAPPQLEKAPAPPKQELGKGMMEFMQVAALLGAIAGGRGRGNSTAAMNAFAGAMNGFHNGQKEQFETNLEEWKARSQQVATDNQAKLDQYNLIWKNKQLSMDQKMGMFRIASQQWKDDMTYNAAKAGDAQTLAAMLQKQWQIQTQYVEAKNKLTIDIEKVIQQGKAMNDRGSVEKMMMIQWTQAFTQKNGREPTPEETSDHLAGIRSQMSYARAAGTQSERVEQATNELKTAIPIASDASKALPRGKWVPWNKLKQMYLAGKSDPAYNDFMVKALTAQSAYVRAMNPQGIPRVADREELKSDQILSTAISPEAFEKQLRALWLEAVNSKNATNKTRTQSGQPDPNETTEPFPGDTGAPAQPAPDRFKGFSVVKTPGAGAEPQAGTGL